VEFIINKREREKSLCVIVIQSTSTQREELMRDCYPVYFYPERREESAVLASLGLLFIHNSKRATWIVFVRTVIA